MPVFIAYFGADWRYQFVNAAYEQWYGKPRLWFVGRTVREVMGEESFARIEAQMHRVMGGEAVHFVFERRAPNGDYTRVLDTHFVPDIGANGVQGIYALVTDHTERRLAEDAALRARWEMRAVADNLPSLITYIDADMRYRYVNAGFLAWYQQPPDAFIGHQVADVVGPSFTLTGPLMQRALQGESLDFDYARRNDYFADPERILRVRLLPDTVAGITRGFIALIDDITDARQANAALRRAEQELRAVIDTIPELVAAFDMQARFIYVNRSFAAWYGAPEQWFPGLHLEDVLAPALTSTVMPAIRRVMTGARVSVQPEGALIRPCDGAQRFYRTNYAPFMDGDVQRGFVATAQDITEWVEANRALRQQEIRLRQIADASSDAFWLLTLDNATPFYVSPGFEAIFGRRCAEAHGNAVGWLEAIHSEDRERMANAFSAMLNGAHLDAEYRILRPDGEVRWVHDKARLVRDGRGMPLAIAGVVSDVSERRLQHSELVEYARRLEHAQTVGTLGFLQVELTGQSVLWSA